MAKIAVIADIDTVSCFKLAGVKNCYPVKDAKEAEKRLFELSKNPDVAIIVLTERVAEGVQYSIEKIAREQIYPIILAIPDKKGPMERKVDPIAQLIKRTIGVEVKVE